MDYSIQIKEDTHHILFLFSPNCLRCTLANSLVKCTTIFVIHKRFLVAVRLRLHKRHEKCPKTCFLRFSLSLFAIIHMYDFLIQPACLVYFLSCMTMYRGPFAAKYSEFPHLKCLWVTVLDFCKAQKLDLSHWAYSHLARLGLGSDFCKPNQQCEQGLLITW